MTFISFAQNLEDVMLYRALKHLDTGFYIDVGAHDSVSGSVTKAFYDRGWHGINIEPVPHWHQRLACERPRDTNLQIAASSTDGVLRIFEIPDTGLSTIEPQIAERHADAGYRIHEREVQCRRLDRICEELNVEQIHFLKVDVEGAEVQVLEGISFKRFRPWIVVVEATEPNSQISTHEKWEHVLVNNNYSYVYFDGLNRFYIAAEHDELKESFGAPPNIFDSYVRHTEHSRTYWTTRMEHRLRKNVGRYWAYLKSVWPS